MILLSVATGILAGLAARGLETSLRIGVRHLIGRAADPAAVGPPAFRGRLLLLPALGGLASGLLVTLLGRSRVRGTAEFIEAFHHRGGALPLGGAALKAAAAVAVISTGGSVGIEVPIAVLGAAIGSFLGRRLPPRERRLCLVAGCAAGVGAIFHCPLGGALFASTVLYRDPEIEGDAVVPSILASVSSYSTFMAFGGFGSRLFRGTESLSFGGAAEIPAYLALTLFCVLAGFLFHHGLRIAGNPRWRRGIPSWAAPAAAGLLGGALACALPQVADARYVFLQAALDGRPLTFQHSWAWWGVFCAVLLLAKIAATSLMLGSGGAGGLFGPVVFMGGIAGAATGAFLEALWPSAFPEPLRECLIPVGMAGFLSVTFRTPLAAIAMVTEMTGTYGLIVPLMLVSMLSYLLGRRWGAYDEQVPGLLDSPVHAGENLVSFLERARVGPLAEPADSLAVRPETSFPEIVSRLSRGGRSSLLVLDGGRPAGILTTSDLAALPGLEDAGRILVAADLMRPCPAMVLPGDPLYETLDLFRSTGADLLPVVGGHGGVCIGVLSRSAVAGALRRWREEQEQILLRERRELGVLVSGESTEGLISELVAPAGVAVRTVPVPPEAVGRSLADLEYRRRYGAVVVAVRAGGGRLQAPPDPRRPLAAGDLLFTLPDRPSAPPPAAAGPPPPPAGG